VRRQGRGGARKMGGVAAQEKKNGEKRKEANRYVCKRWQVGNFYTTPRGDTKLEFLECPLRTSKKNIELAPNSTFF
jgi:hypothetical protein